MRWYPELCSIYKNLNVFYLLHNKSLKHKLIRKDQRSVHKNHWPWDSPWKKQNLKIPKNKKIPNFKIKYQNLKIPNLKFIKTHQNIFELKWINQTRLTDIGGLKYIDSSLSFPVVVLG